MAQRLEGTLRILSTDDIPWECEKLGEVVAEPAVATTGVETIVNLVKSDAAGTAWADGCQMSGPAEGEHARCRSRFGGEHKRHWFRGNFFVVRMVNPLDVDTALANIAKYTLNTENTEELRRRIATIGDGEIVRDRSAGRPCELPTL